MLLYIENKIKLIVLYIYYIVIYYICFLLQSNFHVLINICMNIFYEW